MFGRYSHLLIALVANRPLAQLAQDAPGEQGEPGAQAQEAHLPLLDVLLDVHVDRQALQLGLGHDRSDMYNFLQR